MPQTMLGIDLGSYSVKIAQVDRSFGEFKLVNFYEMPLVAEEVLTYEQSASAALAKFFSENPIRYDSCVLSLPGSWSSLRLLTLPFTSTKKIDQTLEYELETLVPFELEELLFDYAVLDRVDQQSKILAAYVREEEFKRFLAQIQLSGVEPRSIGIDTADLAYLTLLDCLPPEGMYALLDLGHTKTNLLILEGNRVKALRCLSWGGHEVTQAIAQALGVSYKEAEAFKHGKGQFQPESDDPALQAIARALENLLAQVQQTFFSFYESGERPIEALYLFGGTSQLVGIDSFFSNRLYINVSPLDVLEETYTRLTESEAVRPKIPMAFAAALKALYPLRGVSINFRQGEYAYKKDFEQLSGTLKKLAGLGAAALAVAIAYFVVAYTQLSSQVDSMNQNLARQVGSVVPNAMPKSAKPSTTTSIVALLDGKTGEMKEKLKKVQVEKELGVLEVLGKISASLPPRDALVVDVSSVNISPKGVVLEGRVGGSYQGFDTLKASIGKIKEFKNIQAEDRGKVEGDSLKFKISFNFVTE